MMKRLILVMLLLISQISFGQELIDFSVSSCSEKSYPEYIRSRVIRKELENDTLTVRLGLVLNCCIDPNISLSFENNSLFFQIDDLSSAVCMCECCFEIEVIATGFDDSDFQVVYKKPIWNSSSEDFETIYADYPLEISSRKYLFPHPSEIASYLTFEDETNQLTADSLKVGLWKGSRDSIDILTFHYIDKNGQSKMDWGARFEKNGLLIDICGLDTDNELSCLDRREYFKLFKMEQLQER